MRVPKHEIGVAPTQMPAPAPAADRPKPVLPQTSPEKLPTIAAPATPMVAPASSLPVWDKDDHVSLLDPSIHDGESVPSSLVSEKLPVQPAVSSGGEVSLRAKKTVPELDRMIRAAASESIGVRGIGSIGGTKTPVSDITSAVPQPRRSMGPIDELRSFTLADWRRVGSPSMSAAEVVWKKFSDLKQESYLLFMDGVRAWHESPLFRMYLATMTAALAQGVSLSAVLNKEAGAGGMTIAESLSIIDINSRLT